MKDIQFVSFKLKQSRILSINFTEPQKNIISNLTPFKISTVLFHPTKRHLRCKSRFIRSIPGVPRSSYLPGVPLEPSYQPLFLSRSLQVLGINRFRHDDATLNRNPYQHKTLNQLKKPKSKALIQRTV